MLIKSIAANQEDSFVNHDRHNHPPSQPVQQYVGHHEHGEQLKNNMPDPDLHEKQGGQNKHTAHDKHSGHSLDMFRCRFVDRQQTLGMHGALIVEPKDKTNQLVYDQDVVVQLQE